MNADVNERLTRLERENRQLVRDNRRMKTMGTQLVDTTTERGGAK